MLATIYLAVYVILIFLSSAASGARWGVYVYFLAPVLEDHSLVLLVLPGYRTRRGCNAVPACRQAISCNARARAGGSRHRRLALGLELLLVPQHERWFWSRMLVTAARITAPELLLAAIAIYAGRRFGRASAYIPGPGPERDRLAGDAGRFDWADLHLLAEFRGARTCDCQHHTADLRAPGAAAVRGRLVPATGRATIHPVLRHRPVDRCGGVVYTLVLVDIRQAWNLGAPTLIGPTSQSEFYAYSIATLIFGILLMVLPAPRRQGVELRFRARGHRESLPVRRRSLDRAVAGPELPVDGPQFPWDFLGLRAVRVRYRPAQTKGGRKAALSLRNPRDAYISAP